MGEESREQRVRQNVVKGSVFSEIDRIEKLINLDYTFEKCYGKEPIVEKYYHILKQQRERLFNKNAGLRSLTTSNPFEGDGVLGYSPETGPGLNTFGARGPYELTVGGES